MFSTSKKIVPNSMMQIVIWACFCLCAFHLLYSAYCALTWGKFTLVDYGYYTNMIWNSGHGDLFRLRVDESYLQTHLSFTLALIGPLFRLWDHPFLLSAVQWCGLVLGAWILFRSALRLGASRTISSVLALFYIAYPFSQSVVLSEFHGVGLYLLLLPWLHYALRFGKGSSWIPFVLLLGTREEAGLLAIPLCIYVAVTDRWKIGYVYAALALAYVWLAVQVLFPYFNEISLLETRPAVGGQALIEQWRESSNALRVAALLWMILPALPFLRRGWIPILVVPLAAVLLGMGSPYKPQYAMYYHYPAAFMACLGVALVEAAPRIRRTMLVVTALLMITLIAHHQKGFLVGGGKHLAAYREVHESRAHALTVAQGIPKDGLLLTTKELAAYGANRPDIIAHEQWSEYRDAVQYVFVSMKALLGRHGHAFRELMKGDEFGVRYFDGDYLVMERDIDPSENQRVLEACRLARNTLRIANMHHHAGENVPYHDSDAVRHWAGRGQEAPAFIGFGRSCTLEAGRHHALLRYDASAPREPVVGYWGRVEFLDQASQEIFLQVDIEQVPAGTRQFHEQRIPLELSERINVEVRVIGGDAELWLDSIRFVPVD